MVAWQCDQIGQHFATLAKIVKVFGHCLRVYLVLGKMLHLLWQFLWFGLHFSLLHVPKKEHVVI